MADPLQQRALSALAPFLALAPSATSSRSVIELIQQATSAPDTYLFAELLATPQVQSLRDSSSSDGLPHLHHLEIFAWGTLADYNCITPPPFSPASQGHTP